MFWHPYPSATSVRASMAALSARMTHLQAFRSARLSFGCHSDVVFWFSHATRDTHYATRTTRHATRAIQHADLGM